MAVFGLIPEEPRQALRVRRFLMAVGTALLVSALLYAGAEASLVPREGALRAIGMTFALLAVFYVLLRSGANLRFRDPSLTFEMCASAILVVAYALHHAERVRGMGSILYFVVMLFGVFRLGTGRMLALAALALFAHGTVLALAGVRSVSADTALEIGQFLLLAILLPWFATMGGYVSRLRTELGEANRKVSAALARIEEIAVRDELTGVYNRRFVYETLQREASRAARLGTPLSVCLFDLDNFKQVNDSYGHAAGDEVLKRFTEVAARGLRGVDVLARHGGEEFLLVLPDTDLKGALACAERVRANVEREEFPGIPPTHRVTVTGAAACAKPAEDVDALVARADDGLYRGKRGGRNRVEAMNG